MTRRLQEERVYRHIELDFDDGVKPLIHQSEISSPLSRKKFLSLCTIVKTTEWNRLIKIDI